MNDLKEYFANMQGMEIIEIPYKSENFAFPYEDIYQSLKILTPEILIICNPRDLDVFKNLLDEQISM